MEEVAQSERSRCWMMGGRRFDHFTLHPPSEKLVHEGPTMLTDPVPCVTADLSEDPWGNQGAWLLVTWTPNLCHLFISCQWMKARPCHALRCVYQETPRPPGPFLSGSALIFTTFPRHFLLWTNIRPAAGHRWDRSRHPLTICCWGRRPGSYLPPPEDLVQEAEAHLRVEELWTPDTDRSWDHGSLETGVSNVQEPPPPPPSSETLTETLWTVSVDTLEVDCTWERRFDARLPLSCDPGGVNPSVAAEAAWGHQSTTQLQYWSKST